MPRQIAQEAPQGAFPLGGCVWGRWPRPSRLCGHGDVERACLKAEVDFCAARLAGLSRQLDTVLTPAQWAESQREALVEYARAAAALKALDRRALRAVGFQLAVTSTTASNSGSPENHG